MQAYRSDRMVRVLTTVVSIVYFALWGGALLVLILVPVLKMFAGNDRDWVLGLGAIEVELPATALDSVAAVPTTWGPMLAEVHANLKMPIALLPWSVVAMVWMHLAVWSALMLLFLHHLRRIFQRVRQGAPFDAHNALRLRWLGLLLLALAVFTGVVELVTSLAVREWLARSNITVSTGLHIDGSLVFVALVLIALAEIFRRGAELEHEQSLVV